MRTAIRTLLGQLGEPLLIEHENAHIHFLQLPSLGINIIFSKQAGCFQAVVFELDSDDAADNHRPCYPGDLPNGVTAGDSRSDVEQKLRVAPIKQSTVRGKSKCDFVDYYQFGNNILAFTFGADGLWNVSAMSKTDTIT